MTRDTESNAISFVVPVYKSASTLLELHTRMGELARNENWRIEIIYVNDASPDHSFEILRNLPNYPAHSIYRLTQNHGQSTALITGIAQARYPLFATLDADLQDDPAVTGRLITALKPDHDVAFAIRTGRYEGYSRLVTSYLFKTLVTLFSGGRIPRNAGLFLAGRTDRFKSMVAYLPDRPYLIGLISKLNLKCVSVAVSREKNKYGETSYTFKKRLGVARSFFRTLYLKKSVMSYEKWLADYLVIEKERSIG